MRYKYLDSLRGIACLMVMIAHIISTDSKIGMYAWGCGTVGVWFFMVLAGFLLLYRYLEDDNKNFGVSELPKYYLGKVLRLVPSYFLAIVMATVMGLINISDWKAHMLLKYGWGHFWYMPVIIKFYLVAPVILLLYSYLKKKRRGKLFFSAFLLIFFCIISLVFSYKSYPSQSLTLIWYVPVFIMGMFLAILMHFLSIKSRNADIFVFIPIISVLIFTPLFRKLIWGIEPSYYLSNKYMYVGAMWGLFVFFLEKGNVWKSLFEKSIILQKIGDYSYDIYLVHFIIVIKLSMMGVSNLLLKLLIVIGVSIGFASVLNILRRAWQRRISSKISISIVVVFYIMFLWGENVFIL